MAFFGCDGIDRYIRCMDSNGGGCGDAGGWVGNVLIFAIDEARARDKDDCSGIAVGMVWGSVYLNDDGGSGWLVGSFVH